MGKDTGPWEKIQVHGKKKVFLLTVLPDAFSLISFSSLVALDIEQRAEEGACS
jgi:hypothetical protein